MLFNSFIFLYLFLPVTYFIFWRLKRKNQRYLWLTITSYIFYGYWNYKFCFWMALSTCVSYFAGLGLLKTEDPKWRRFFLVAPITVDLLILGVFKYTNFLLGSIDKLLAQFQVPAHLPVFDIVLPIGISFYTFHTITYIVDGYRRTIKPTRDFLEFSCYVSLFSQLVAGPIVRFRQIERDLEAIDHANRKQNLDIGWSFFTIGLVKKVLLADSIATIINPALKNYLSLSTWDAWGCMLGYSYQLYFDFSGYSDMAVGLGLIFGLRLPQNFNSPYKATSIADFWRRWHISLSSCLRDYLYIPLGGNRGNKLFVARNLMITFLLGGLWHGANWTFVIWGAYHGFLLALQSQVEPAWEKLPLFLKRSVTFLLVVIGWVFFRSDNFTMAFHLLKKMFIWTNGPAIVAFPTLLALIVLCYRVAHVTPNTFEIPHKWKPWQSAALAFLFILCLFVMYGGQESPFLYFQF